MGPACHDAVLVDTVLVETVLVDTVLVPKNRGSSPRPLCLATGRAGPGRARPGREQM
ncbi:hypothetical protein GCM10009590_25440 [Brachybacterium alimentarium]